jgi:threonine/homoserine/homoserine lactone efflux protein
VLDSFAAGAIAGYGIAIPVGPVAVLIIELGVRRGFRLAAPAGLGAATADGLYALLAVLAGASIAQLLDPITPALQVIAVVVLTLIALRGFWLALYHARIGIPGNAELPAEPSRTYLRFLAITLLNPTTILYFAALILGRPELGSGPAERAAFIVGAALASTSWQLFLALLGSLFHQRLPWKAQLGISLLGNAVVLAFAIVIARGIQA